MSQRKKNIFYSLSLFPIFQRKKSAHVIQHNLFSKFQL